MPLNQSTSFSVAPKPPSLHWAIVLLLTVVTFGLFGFVWMIVQASYIKKIDPSNRALYQVLLAAVLFGFQFLISAVVTITVARGGQGTDLGSVMNMLRFFQILMVITAYLQIRKTLTQNFGMKLNGVMTVLFNVYYVQYHFSQMAKTQGVTLAGAVSA